jgi:hypothetical protein
MCLGRYGGAADTYRLYSQPGEYSRRTCCGRGHVIFRHSHSVFICQLSAWCRVPGLQGPLIKGKQRLENLKPDLVSTREGKRRALLRHL